MGEGVYCLWSRRAKGKGQRLVYDPVAPINRWEKPHFLLRQSHGSACQAVVPRRPPPRRPRKYVTGSRYPIALRRVQRRTRWESWQQ